MGIINSKHFFRQHGAGTVTWPTADKWSGGNKTLTSTANAVDLVTKYYDGINYYNVLNTNFS
jgi:hypothetical protein